jgi:exosortase/archaeosortase
VDDSQANSKHGQIAFPSKQFLCRVCLTAVFATVAHLLSWDGLRFFTSEVTLRLSAMLGMTTARAAFDTIEIQGNLIQFVVCCTFVELFFGSLPLIWRGKDSIVGNLSRVVIFAGAIFGLNIVRLVLLQIAYGHGVPWTLAHDIPVGVAYFAVWVFIWRTRDWPAWQYRSRTFHALTPLAANES